MRALARIFAGLTAVAVIAAGAFYFVMLEFQEPGTLAEETIVQVPRGTGLNAIADRLAEADVIDNRWIFIAGVYANRQERALQAGEYAFPANVSPEEAMGLMATGQTVTYSVTVPEGRTSAEIVAILQEEDRLAGEIESVPPEGALLPETYHYVRGDSRESILGRMEAAMDEALATAWEAREEGLPYETPEEALTMASIIEKETGVAGERPMVASVFVNRLRRGMPLQSDPTVIYALTEGAAPLGRELLRTDWAFESPYNTYHVTGLPPGPIANPGIQSIQAALNPADTDYLYFVADGTGGHAFAETLAEHNRNVAQWRRVRQQSGE